MPTAKESTRTGAGDLESRLEAVVERFEDARGRGQDPSIDAYLPGDSGRWAVLLELVHADLEGRLKAGESVRVEDYLQRYPELRRDGRAVFELVAAEWRLRLRREPGLSVAEYLRRFPAHREELLGHRPDEEPRLDASGRSPCGSHPTARPAAPATFKASGPQPSEDLPATLPAIRPGAVHGAGLPEVAGYEILEVLGRGGMGIVYRARQLRPNRLVALKMILEGRHSGPAIVDRFRREAEALAQLQHPNIVQVYEVGEQGGRPFFSLELVEGGSLDRRLAGTPQPGGPSAELVETLARAVDFAHRRGVVHRDLKPANVLLTADGTPKIADFGLAKQLHATGEQTGSDAILGTPSYMAPEQTGSGMGEVGPASDVYSLGAILYELLTGRPPFKGATPLETVMQARADEPVPPSRLSGCPRDLETVCVKCLEKDPHKRYASARDLAEDLRRFRKDEPIRARPVGPVERVAKWTRRRPAVAALWAVSVAAVLVLIGGGALLQHLRLRTSVTQAQADAARAREEARRAGVENQARQLLLAAREALANGQQAVLNGHEAQARQQLAEALRQAAAARELLQPEPGLTELRASATHLLAEVEGRDRARTHRDQLFRLRDEALFLLKRHLVTGEDPAASLRQARELAETALRPFRGSHDGTPAIVLGDLYGAEEKAEVARGCFEVLLIQAEALTSRLPGRPEQERRRLAGEALALLDLADGLVAGTRIVRRRRARYLLALGDEAGGTRERRQADREGPAAPADGPASALDALLVGCDRWFEEGDVRGAIREFERARPGRGDQFWVHFFRALAYQKAQDQGTGGGDGLAEARASLSVCAGLRPDFLWTYLLRGFLHAELGAFALAEDDLSRAERLERLHPDESARYVLHVDRGFVRLRQGKSEDGIAELRAAIGLRPEQYQAYVDLAQAYYGQAERKENPPDPAARQRLLDGAARQMDEAIRRHADSPALYRTRARIHLARQDLTVALRDVDEALRREPAGGASRERATANLERAVILYRQHQYAEAVKGCAEALRERPDFLVVRRLQGECLLRLAAAAGSAPDEAARAREHYRGAVRAFDQYTARGRPVAAVYRARAQAHVGLGEYAAAADDYTLALALEPDCAALHVLRGQTYLALHAAEPALADFDRAVRLDPVAAEAYAGRGQARARVGRFALALADAREAARRGPDRPQVLVNAAGVYALLVGAMDRDRPRQAVQDLETRSAYQDEAVYLLRAAVDRVPDRERRSFWEQVQGDAAFNPVRQAAAFRRLASRYGGAAR
jgi:tetratricopeptide (TPR) repeat protein